MVGLSHDRWLSRVLARDVFRLDMDKAGQGTCSELPGLEQRLTQHARQYPGAFYYAKVDTTAIQAVRSLCRVGFYVVDVNVTLGLDLRAEGLSRDPCRQRDLTVRQMGPQDCDSLLDIAASCFRYSRFHLDPVFPEALAHRVKREWIASYVRQERGETLFVALVAHQPVGFLAVLAPAETAKTIRIIDLVGISPAWQGRGIGEALVARCIAHYRSQCDVLQVGTQVANIPSLRLYQKLGFGMVTSTYVLHMHT